MKSILTKLTKSELKELSNAINKANAKYFGNPLSLRKKEQFIADVFNQKDWHNTLSETKKCEHQKVIKNVCAECKRKVSLNGYQKTIVTVEILSDGFYSDKSLGDIVYDIIYGDVSGSILDFKRIPLNQDEMKKSLIEQGSDPEFLINNSISDKKKKIIENIEIECEKDIDSFDTLDIAETISIMWDYCQKFNNNAGITLEDLDDYFENKFGNWKND